MVLRYSVMLEAVSKSSIRRMSFTFPAQSTLRFMLPSRLLPSCGHIVGYTHADPAPAVPLETLARNTPSSGIDPRDEVGLQNLAYRCQWTKMGWSLSCRTDDQVHLGVSRGGYRRSCCGVVFGGHDAALR